ncbi:MAG: SDR family oxidoreductase [Candidatus Nanopelagicales bacterium]
MSRLISEIPVGRLGQPADVADLVAFLCSEHANLTTGVMVDINGGYLIH